MGNIIDGKLIAEKFQSNIKDYIKERAVKGLRAPCLVTIICGDDGGSLYYLNNQSRLCREVGIEHKIYKLSKDVSHYEIATLIQNLNNDGEIDGIMLQLPLPKHLDQREITSLIFPQKDVDGLTDINMGRFYKGEKCFVPCTPQGIIELIKSTGITIEGMHAVVIGRSNIAGKPAAQLLINENATVTLCHSKTKNIKDICKRADILVCAIGKPHYIDDNFIKDGAVLIDVGTTMINGKVCGDIDFDKVIKKASYITPVPGGVGSMTTTMLMKNTCEAAEINVY